MAKSCRHGRFRIRPPRGTEYLSNADAAAKSEAYLFDEFGQRLAKGPVTLGVFVQMAEPGDDVTDASVPWPDSRPEIAFVPSIGCGCQRFSADDLPVGDRVNLNRLLAEAVEEKTAGSRFPTAMLGAR